MRDARDHRSTTKALVVRPVEPVPLGAARLAHARLRALMTGRPGVCGVGLCRRGEGYVLRVNVVDAAVDVPTDVDGVPVEVRTTGPVAASGR
ncbi:hypothetical protein HP550_09940 [Cellulomonas humilata]|uniref:Uncharacterized protein n=1 Tax=Cellulomonas humilata TaxID=144055 RepID=A0A7Y6DWL6_9CELL|nr:hypothetical protein [Cellulomonas humilata]NUU17571.1 hypothetical protein [Cellulomonas humilata]